MPSLSIMKLMLFVPKVAAVTPYVSAPEQKTPGKDFTDVNTEFCAYSSKEFDPELKLTELAETNLMSFKSIVINSG